MNIRKLKIRKLKNEIIIKQLKSFQGPTSGSGRKVLTLIGLMSQIHLPPTVELAASLMGDDFSIQLPISWTSKKLFEEHV